MYLLLGIDPGITGALVIIEGGSMAFVDMLLTPTIKVGSKNRLNGAAIDAWLRQYPGISHAFLEQVNAMPSGGKGPKMGAGSAFTFGHAAGYVEGVVTGAQIPLTLVTPQKWKKHAGLIGTDKDAARSRAIQLYPGIRTLDLIGKGQAMADALLIARYGNSTLTHPTIGTTHANSIATTRH